jgi:hypothetical protein
MFFLATESLVLFAFTTVLVSVIHSWSGKARFSARLESLYLIPYCSTVWIMVAPIVQPVGAFFELVESIGTGPFHLLREIVVSSKSRGG